jgi:hypothetical protein
VRHFPHTVQLDRDYRNDGLAVVSVSVNEADKINSVREFLETQKATFDNIIVDDLDAWGELGGAVNPPSYRLYDRKGKLRYRFSPLPEGDEKQLDEIPDRLDELLSE